MTTNARQLVDGLARLGVERVFTLSGNQILAIYDACLDAGIAVTDTRHEAAAGHMAEAWARLRGVPGVCLVSAGPGHTNTLTAMANARASETPVLWLSGAGDHRHAGKGGFQEFDQVGTATAVCKGSRALQPGDQVTDLLVWAWRTMLSDTPGPVHLSLPADLLVAAAGGPSLDPATCRPAPERLDPQLVSSIAVRLASAQRPLVLASPSVSRAAGQETMGALWEQAGIPTFVIESPRGMTDPALHGRGGVTARADVVLLLAPQDFAVALAGPRAIGAAADLIHVTATPAGLGINRNASVSAVADGAALLSALSATDVGRAADRTAWHQELAEAKVAAEQRFAHVASATRSPIHPLALMEVVQSTLPPGCVVSIDGGEFAQWARWGMADSDATALVNGKFGMLGPALPFAIAARLARPDAVSVAFLGDGTAGYHLLEFDTAVRHGVPFVAVIGNDAGWAAERHRQVALYGADRLVAADLLPTRYDQLVAALGGHGEFVTTHDEIKPAMERALASQRPACVNVLIDSVPSPADPV